MGNTRITEKLSWSAMKENYFIGNRMTEILERDKKGNVILINNQPKVVKSTVFVNELQEAIDNGTIDTLVKECADLYHAGNVQSVLTALAKNLDSQRCNMKKREYNPSKKTDEARLETLTNFVNSRRECKTRTAGKLPQWAYGPTEIDAIEDAAQLQKVINSINDVCCDKSHGSYAKYLGEDYIEAAKANREYARKRKAMLDSKASTTLPDDILAKFLSGDKNVVFTAEQAAKIMKLLSK